jgi:PIN domain nuclease of toxin-antitoxin system
LGIPFRKWVQRAIPSGEIEVLPLSVEICAESNDLPGSFGNDDPFDQIIVATARVHDLTLVSCDGAVRQYPHVKKWCYRRQG